LCCAPLTGGWGAQPLWDAGSGALDPAGDGGAAESRPRRAPNLPAAHRWPLAGRRRCGAADHDVRARRREGRTGLLHGVRACIALCVFDGTYEHAASGACQLLQGRTCRGASSVSALARRLRDAAPELAQATCLAVACPACMTLELARSCAPYVTTIVNNADIVPTISPGTLALGVWHALCSHTFLRSVNYVRRAGLDSPGDCAASQARRTRCARRWCRARGTRPSVRTCAAAPWCAPWRAASGASARRPPGPPHAWPRHHPASRARGSRPALRTARLHTLCCAALSCCTCPVPVFMCRSGTLETSGAAGR